MTCCDTSYDAIIVGAGFAGAVVARELAERGGMKVLVFEAREHIGGNAYDCYDEAGVLIHLYGPHIFHTNDKRVYEYLSRFTSWYEYEHEVLANVYGQYLPVPFNKNSMRIAFGKEEATRLIAKLIETFGDERKVTINELRAQEDPDLAKIADYVYENVFLHYTQKQWGLTPEQVDPSVTARVPVFISEDNRYFQDAYQGMPKDGYTALFKTLLDYPGIEVCCNIDAREKLSFKEEGGKVVAIECCGKPFSGPVIYTGPLDELFNNRFGRLPYRSLDFIFKTLEQDVFQTRGTINYTVDQDYTRITEYKYLTGQKLDGTTTIMEEYPCAYTGAEGQIPYYAIISEANQTHYKHYLDLFSEYSAFYPLGRLAEYKYYNMDVICARALDLADKLLDAGE